MASLLIVADRHLVAHSLLSYARSYIIETGALSSSPVDAFKNSAVSCLRLLPILDVAIKFKDMLLTLFENLSLSEKENIIIQNWTPFLEKSTQSSTISECASIIQYFIDSYPHDKDIVQFRRFLGDIKKNE